ncbi:hypothetical protein K432DRAFT_282864, partial [Lepidopterella palustris CBS 459.81]
PTSHNATNLPPPNQKDAGTRVSLVIGVEVSTTSVMVVFVSARFYMRTFVKKVLGMDDWVMAVAAILATTTAILNCVETRHSLGLHIWNIPQELLEPASEVRTMGLISVALFVTCTALTKISMCIAYLRILITRSNRIFCYCAMSFVLATWIYMVFIIIFQAVHLFSPWDFSKSPLNREAVLLSFAVINSISDFLIFLWPSRTLWTVRLPTKQRLGLVFVFSIGCIVCVAGVSRIAYIIQCFHSPDIFYNVAVVYIICAVEANVGIICGCLPILKPLLARYFHSIFGNNIPIKHSIPS